jgi:hypothetical protein
MSDDKSLTAREWREAVELIAAEWEAMSALPLHEEDSRLAYLERRGALRYSLGALLGREDAPPRIALQWLRARKAQAE